MLNSENIQLNWIINLTPVLSIKGKNNFASYLSGHIEGDGTIIVPSKNITSYRPYFEIVFHIDDLILA